MRPWRYLAFLALAVAFVAHLPERSSAATTTQQASPMIDPKADQVLRQLATYMAGLKGFSVEVTSQIMLRTLKGEEPTTIKYICALHMPDRLAMIQTTSHPACTIISNGKRLYTYMPPLNKYVIEEAYESLGKIPGWYLGQANGGGSIVFCGSRRNPYAFLRGEAPELHYKGTETIDGVECHHLHFRLKAYDSHLWVDTSDTPLIRKASCYRLRLYVTPEARRIVPEPKPLSVTVFNNWKTDTNPPEELFRIRPPAGAKPAKVLELEELGCGAAYSLRGKPAPAFAARQLDGKILLPGRLKGNVVVLVFWASGFGSCHDCLNAIGQIAQKYERRGVLFHAINFGDRPEVMRQTAARFDIRIPQAADPAKAMSNAYGVGKPPHIVIIGRDGTVQFVRVFWPADAKARVTAALDLLLAGKTLYGPDGTSLQEEAPSPQTQPSDFDEPLMETE